MFDCVHRLQNPKTQWKLFRYATVCIQIFSRFYKFWLHRLFRMLQPRGSLSTLKRNQTYRQKPYKQTQIRARAAGAFNDEPNFSPVFIGFTGPNWIQREPLETGQGWWRDANYNLHDTQKRFASIIFRVSRIKWTTPRYHKNTIKYNTVCSIYNLYFINIR